MAVSDNAAATTDQAPADTTSAAVKSKTSALKELAGDESLSEEARDSAKKALEVMVSSQLLDIEQAATLKKLESEADFVHQHAQIEALAESKMEIKKLEAEAHLKRQRVEAKKMLQAVEHLELEEMLSDEMAEWLVRHRLHSCATDIARIAGAYAHHHCLLPLPANSERARCCLLAGLWSRAPRSP